MAFVPALPSKAASWPCSMFHSWPRFTSAGPGPQASPERDMFVTGSVSTSQTRPLFPAGQEVGPPGEHPTKPKVRGPPYWGSCCHCRRRCFTEMSLHVKTSIERKTHILSFYFAAKSKLSSGLACSHPEKWFQ